jgi:hypothetical protein
MDLHKVLSEVAGFNTGRPKDDPLQLDKNRRRRHYKIYKDIPTKPPQATQLGQAITVGEAEKESGDLIATFDGWRVLLVDGKRIRDEKEVSFIGGDNPAADRSEMPAKTIWIEKMPDRGDELAFLIHELVEFFRITHDDHDYEEAHKDANLWEGKYREKMKPSEIFKKVMGDHAFGKTATGLWDAFAAARAERIEESVAAADDINYWTKYARHMSFSNEESAHDWIAGRIMAGDNFGPKPDRSTALTKAISIPTYKQLGRTKIGRKPERKREVFGPDDIRVIPSTHECVATSGFVAPFDFKGLSPVKWVPVSSLEKTEAHTEKEAGRSKAEKIANSIRQGKEIRAILVQDGGVVDGHHRFTAIKDFLKWDKVPVQEIITHG